MDTGAWLAAIHRRDQYHTPAASCLRQLKSERATLVVTNLILAELHLHLVHSLGSTPAADNLETILADPMVEEVFADREVESRALSDWIRGFADQPFTFTDAVSFAVMRSQRINEAFTFDRHFAVAGFTMLPG